MLFLLILALCTGIGVYIFMNHCEELGLFMGIISGITLLVALIVIPINRASHYDEIQQYNAVKMTIEESRKSNISDIERAAIINKIASWNAKIASLRYWNDTIFDIYIPDEATKLEYLK
jgi:hypothetical protein